MTIQKGDKVKFNAELKKKMATPALKGFNHNRPIYDVLDTWYSINNVYLAELNNDGIHYLIDCELLVVVKAKTVGIIIE